MSRPPKLASKSSFVARKCAIRAARKNSSVLGSLREPFDGLVREAESPSVTRALENSGLASEQIEEISSLAGPLLRHPAVLRLGRISFLGALSPRYRLKYAATKDDGSRLDHSVGVAALALDAAKVLALPLTQRRYAVAWGLLHDVATWPLSHTVEAAFEEAVHAPYRAVREAMIQDSSVVPPPFHLAGTLREIGVNPDTLCLLFAKRRVSPFLTPLAHILHSRINPDTLEGICRAAWAFGLMNIPAAYFIRRLSRARPTITVDTAGVDIAQDFWRLKMEVYARFLDAPRVRAFEYKWELAVRLRLPHLSLAESLFIEEDQLVSELRPLVDSMRPPLPPERTRQYAIAGEYDEDADHLSLDELNRMFQRSRQG